MGLDIGLKVGEYAEDGHTYPETEGNVHFSYGGFSRFRKGIARTIDVDLDSMQGFGGTTPWSTVDSDLVPLLYHSDCDGELTPEEASRVAPVLETAVKAAFSEDDYDYREGLDLVAMLRDSAEHDQIVIFH